MRGGPTTNWHLLDPAGTSPAPLTFNGSREVVWPAPSLCPGCACERVATRRAGCCACACCCCCCWALGAAALRPSPPASAAPASSPNTPCMLQLPSCAGGCSTGGGEPEFAPLCGRWALCLLLPEAGPRLNAGEAGTGWCCSCCSCCCSGGGGDGGRGEKGCSCCSSSSHPKAGSAGMEGLEGSPWGGLCSGEAVQAARCLIYWGWPALRTRC